MERPAAVRIVFKENLMPKRLTQSEITKRLKTLNEWKLKGGEIVRHYEFSAFIPAMAFVNHVAGLAEAMDHHPDILIQYNKVALTLSTHSAGGLTDLDFKLAKKIDA
jgi:4a-hydroxytetrahydrobiopterin dehydratase